MYWNERDILTSQYIFRLTLTWDVLKYGKIIQFRYPTARLTLTWDVLKFMSNIKALEPHFRLTLTWDVLKSW